MKELSIEEKARRYDEAIEKFDVILNLNTVKESGTIFADDVRKILPELKESEDEKIRQWLIDTIQQIPNHSIEWEVINKEDVLAWLEKQGNLITELQKTYAEIGRLIKENYHLKEKQDKKRPVEWSRVDNIIVEEICLALEYSNESGKKIEKYENWLHSIKDRVLLQSKQGEHKPTIEMKSAEESLCVDSDTYNKIVDECIYGEQKPTDKIEPKTTAWKPSDEQLKALKEACDEHWEPDGLDSLYTLYQDLKKLKG